jgi:hypothetical protein
MLVVLPIPASSLSADAPTAESYAVALTPVLRLWHSGEDTVLERESLRQYIREQRILAPWIVE